MNRRTMIALSVVGGILTLFSLMCCGGIVGTMLAGNPTPTAASTDTRAPQRVAGPAPSPTRTATAARPTSTPTARPTTARPTPTRATARPTAKRTPSTRPTTRKPTPRPTTRKATPPASSGGTVHPGAYCSPVGATGRTSKGTLMRCTRKAGDERARWRSA